jgi:hypothetical protein
MYTYAAKLWDSSIVKGLFSVVPCQTLLVPIRKQRFIRCNVRFVASLIPHPGAQWLMMRSDAPSSWVVNAAAAAAIASVSLSPSRSGGGLLAVLAAAPPQLHRRVTRASRSCSCAAARHPRNTAQHGVGFRVTTSLSTG